MDDPHSNGKTMEKLTNSKWDIPYKRDNIMGVSQNIPTIMGNLIMMGVYFLQGFDGICLGSAINQQYEAIHELTPPGIP